MQSVSNRTCHSLTRSCPSGLVKLAGFVGKFTRTYGLAMQERDIRVVPDVRLVPEADIIVATHAQMMACVLEDESPPLDAGFFQTYTINYSSLIYVMA